MSKLDAHPVSGRVTEEDTTTPIADARVAITRKGDKAPFALTRSDPKGAFQLTLPPGEWSAQAHTQGRRLTTPIQFTSPSVTPLNIRLSKAGKLKFALTEGGAPSSGKVIVRGVAPTPDPMLGPAGATTTGTVDRVYTQTGHGEIALPPGTYTVYASRGPEYDLEHTEVTITDDDDK